MKKNGKQKPWVCRLGWWWEAQQDWGDATHSWAVFLRNVTALSLTDSQKIKNSWRIICVIASSVMRKRERKKIYKVGSRKISWWRTPWAAITQKGCDINIYNIVIRRQCLSSIISVTNHIIIDWVFSIQRVFLPLSMISNTLRLFITEKNHRWHYTHSM